VIHEHLRGLHCRNGKKLFTETSDKHFFFIWNARLVRSEAAAGDLLREKTKRGGLDLVGAAGAAFHVEIAVAAYFDFSVGYRFRLLGDRVRTKVQLNVRNAFEGGRLQAIAVNPDGVPYAYRIIDPRQFIFSTSFDL
jgi:hypothetical protein